MSIETSNDNRIALEVAHVILGFGGFLLDAVPVYVVKTSWSQLG